MPARHGQRGAGRQEARAGQPPACDALPEPDGQAAPVAEVARRGDAGAQELVRVAGHPRAQVLGDDVHRARQRGGPGALAGPRHGVPGPRVE